MAKRSKETITLGSGKVYITEFEKGTEIPAHETLETEQNLIGYISGGATLAYEPEFYEAKDDLGYVQKVIITNEEATFTSGVMTWNADTLGKLSATSRVTEDTEKGTRTLKIGGISNQNGKQYLIRFVHEDKADGDVRITIVGQNQAGFTLEFAKDAETVVDAEFKAQPALDDEGTLVIYEEQIEVVPAG